MSHGGAEVVVVVVFVADGTCEHATIPLNKHTRKIRYVGTRYGVRQMAWREVETSFKSAKRQDQKEARGKKARKKRGTKKSIKNEASSR